MPRQSISFTEPNDEWLKTQVENKEYASKSEVINDLIRKARQQQVELELIHSKLAQAEKSGYSTLSPQQIKDKAKKNIKTRG